MQQGLQIMAIDAHRLDRASRMTACSKTAISSTRKHLSACDHAKIRQEIKEVM